jgi:hypothetical protein
MRWLAALVNLATMRNFYDQDYEFGVLDFINNPIASLTDSVLFLIREFNAAFRSRIISQ